MNRRPPILLYHSILPEGEPVQRATQVSARAFRAQLAWVRRAGYRAVTVSELAASPDPGRGRPIAITFDDGYADNSAVAAPILCEFGMSATFFVATGFVGDRSRFNRDWQAPMLTWNELRALAAAGMEIGSHTCSHPPLPALAAEPLSRELRESRVLLEQQLGRPVYSIAYPHGMHSAAVLRAAEHAGYRVGCGVDPTPGAELPWLALPRTMVLERDRGLRLALKLLRLYRRVRSSAVR